MNETAGLIIAGGGVGGLAAALSCVRAGRDVQLFERAPVFSEAGAGVQLGPNVVKVLHGWGLAKALAEVAAFPERLQVRSALSGELLGTLRLGAVMAERYGAPYATVHRGDLHGLLLQAVQQTAARLQSGCPVLAYSQNQHAVSVKFSTGQAAEGAALVGADGLWSTVRQQLLGDGPPRRSGQLAYRALVAQATLPAALRSQQVTVWLGPRMHVVQYPVRGNEWLNLVAIVHGAVAGEMDSWDHSANAAELTAATAGSCSPLVALIGAIPAWRLWQVCDRLPMQGAYQHAQGRVALLGDAAHPMRPYLAQGAGMAIEDAAELGRVLRLAQNPAFELPALLQLYAFNRWQRNARVQAKALRNGQLFHADGWLRRGRDVAMKLLGEKLLDMPWLYGARLKAF